MKVFIDLLTGKEIGSDAAEIKEMDEYKKAIWCTQSAMMKIGGDKVDTGANASSNPDEEDKGEDVDDQVVQVVNLVHTHKLEKQDMKPKDIGAAVKRYFSALEEYLAKKDEDKLKAYTANKPSYAAFFKEVMTNLKVYDIFFCENGIPGECMPVVAKYADGESAPVFFYLKDGFKVEKY